MKKRMWRTGENKKRTGENKERVESKEKVENKERTIENKERTGDDKESEVRVPFSQTFYKQTQKKKKARSTKSRAERVGKAGIASLPVFANRMRLRIEGYNQNRLITLLVREKITIFEVYKQSPCEMMLAIAAKDRQKAFTLIEKMCYNYSVEAVSGTKPLKKWMLARIGLLCGAVIFSIIAIISSQFIWKISISGNENVDSLTIMRQLHERNIRVGGTKRFDSFEARQGINRIDGIMECTIEVVGTTVRVEVIEAKDFIPPDNADEIGDIISLHDAEVTRVIVSGGTGRVGVGDRVHSGEVLISRDILGSSLEVVGQTRAKGLVYGKVYFSQSAVISTSVEQSIRTGNTQVFTTLSLFGGKIGGKKTCKFSCYESVTTTSYAFYNTFVPLRVEQTTYYEVRKSIQEVALDDLVEDFKNQKLLELVINAGGSPIKVSTSTQQLADGLYRVHLYMEAEMLISAFANN